MSFKLSHSSLSLMHECQSKSHEWCKGNRNKGLKRLNVASYKNKNGKIS